MEGDTLMLYTIGVFIFFIGFLLNGCSLEPKEYEVLVSTNRSTYDWNTTNSIEVQVKNVGTHQFYYLCTGQIYLEERHGGKITYIWQVHGFEECLSERSIAPDSKHDFIIPAHAGSLSIDSLISSPLSGELSYTFRVELYQDKKFKEKIPAEQSRSNQIAIIP
jgi:hypothetical protein